MWNVFDNKDNLSFTYLTRIDGNRDALSAYVKLFSVLQRRLFVDVSAGHSSAYPEVRLHPQVRRTREDAQRSQGDPIRSDGSCEEATQASDQKNDNSQETPEAQTARQPETSSVEG